MRVRREGVAQEDDEVELLEELDEELGGVVVEVVAGAAYGEVPRSLATSTSRDSRAAPISSPVWERNVPDDSSRLSTATRLTAVNVDRARA